MKNLLTTIFFFVSVIAYAQSGFNHLKFMGIPINGPMERFHSNLIEKGCTYDSTTTSFLSAGACAFNGILAGYKVRIYVYYNPKSQTVYRVKALIEDMSEKIADIRYIKFKELLSLKYGNIFALTDQNDGKECISFIAVKENVTSNDFESMTKISDIGLGTIDLYFTKDEDDLDNELNNYSINIDYLDAVNSENNEKDVLDSL